MSSLVCGVGINDLPRGVARPNGVISGFYRSWYDMIRRCYDPKELERNPTYKNCAVCEEWLTLSNFKIWYDVNYVEGHQLDKDLLVEGNKVYSPSTCAYVSKELNVLFTDRGKSRGNLPQGVSLTKCKLKYRAYIMKHGKQKHLGTFETPEDASLAYIEAKMVYVLEVIDLHRGVDSDVLLDVLQERYGG